MCPSLPHLVARPTNCELSTGVDSSTAAAGASTWKFFPVAAVVEFVSNIVTLEPGDIISTGTPAGVGAGKGKFLKNGDSMEACIENVGALVNPVVGP